MLGGVGPAFLGSTASVGVDVGLALEAAGGAGYSIISATPITVGSMSYAPPAGWHPAATLSTAP